MFYHPFFTTVIFVKKNNLYICTLLFFLASISFLLPNFYDPWRTAYHDFSMFLVLLILLTTLILNHQFLLIEKNSVFVLSLSFIPSVQFFLGQIYFWGDAFIAFIYILSFGLSILLGLSLSKNFGTSNLLKFICAIIVVTTLISIYILLKQWLLLTNGGVWIVDLPPGGRPFANFAQPNNCATFLCIALMASLYLYEKEYINKFSGVIFSSLILFSLALTQSRMVWVFSLFFLIWWFWKSRYFHTRLKKMSIFYFVGIFISFTISIPYLSAYLGVVSTSDILTRATTGYLRIPMWNQMLLAISKEPLWGYGWNQVSIAQISVFLEYPTTEWIEHTHNILLDLLIWNGIPLALLIIGAFSYWLYHLSKLSTSTEVFIALSMVGAVLVHAMLEYPLEYAFFLLPVGFLLGVIQSTDKNLICSRVPRKIVIVFWSIFIILYVWIFVEYRLIEKDTQLVQFEFMNIGTLHADHDTPDVILLTQLRERIRFIRTKPTENMSLAQQEWMRQVSYRYATPGNLYRYAQALALNNQSRLAKKHLLILEKLYGKKYSFESLFQVNKSLAFEWQNKSISKP